MAYTKFGEFTRILRIKRHELMGEMAEKLGVKVSFLSAVENGKKNVPKDWKEKLSNLYSLNDSDKKELDNAIDESKIQYKIKADKAGECQRQALIKFARSFDNMSDETAIKIYELLNKEDTD